MGVSGQANRLTVGGSAIFPAASRCAAFVFVIALVQGLPQARGKEHPYEVPYFLSHDTD